jgi:hypothetical protein
MSNTEYEKKRAIGGEKYRIFKFYEAVKQKRITKIEAIKELKVIEKGLKYKESLEFLEDILKKIENLS